MGKPFEEETVQKLLEAGKRYLYNSFEVEQSTRNVQRKIAVLPCTTIGLVPIFCVMLSLTMPIVCTEPKNEL